jgi:phosphatidylglycerophosphatase C
MSRLVLFDFDGTITTKDTLLEFIRFYHGTRKFLTGFALNSHWLLLMKLKAIPNWRAKERILEWFFAGEELSQFDTLSARFCREVVPGLIREEALSTIRLHQAEGATVVVISASAANWVEPWCKAYDLPCLATQLEVKDGRITGKIDGINCYGPEKESRIRAAYMLKDFDEILAYGDSKGDREMLALASKKFYRPFRTKPGLKGLD